jgi:hypothetical protein
MTILLSHTMQGTRVQKVILYGVVCTYKSHSVKYVRSQKFIALCITVKSQSAADLQTAMTIFLNKLLFLFIRVF